VAISAPDEALDPGANRCLMPGGEESGPFHA
jgi:hypothetical protein